MGSNQVFKVIQNQDLVHQLYKSIKLKKKETPDYVRGFFAV